MNPAAEGVAADQSYDPENEEDNRDSPKHWVDLLNLMSGAWFAVCNTSLQGRVAFLL